MRILRLLPAFTLFASAAAFAAAPLDEAAQKKQLESLFNTVRPVAVEMISKSGEFPPFGAGMEADGKVSHVAIPPGYSEHPTAAQLIGLLKSSLSGAARAHKIVASALIYSVRVTPPGKQEKTDAIAIDLDHQDGVSLIMICPYQLGADHQPSFGPLLVKDGAHGIFPAATRN